MKHLKTYEKLNKDINIGDIVKYTVYNRYDGNNWSGYDKIVYIGKIKYISQDVYTLEVIYEFSYYKNVENHASEQSAGMLFFLRNSQLNRVKKLKENEFNDIVVKYNANKYNL